MNRRGFFRSIPLFSALAYLAPHVPNRVAPMIKASQIFSVGTVQIGTIQSWKLNGIITANNIASISGDQIVWGKLTPR